VTKIGHFSEEDSTALAKILIIGSRKAHDPVDFQSQCKKIGVALARAGHVIVTAGCGKHDAETWILDGANSASSPGAKTSVIPYSPAVPGTQDLLTLTPAIATRWPNLELGSELKTKGEWAVGQAVALARSDVALLIGGGVLTANIGSLALELSKPYFAVKSMGGTAAVIAEEDYSKHVTMRMPPGLISPNPSDPDFGKWVIAACEFMLKRTTEKTALGKSLTILLVSIAVLATFLAFVFRENVFGNEAQLVYTSSFGALVGVVLSLLVGHVIRHEEIDLSAVIGQLALASFLGVFYGFFALEAGSFYKVEIDRLGHEAFQSLTKNMAFVGVGVGVLLAPAAKKALEELSRVAKITDK
jgi:hypothetical protein